MFSFCSGDGPKSLLGGYVQGVGWAYPVGRYTTGAGVGIPEGSAEVGGYGDTPPLLTPIGGHHMYGCQASGMHPTGMLSWSHVYPVQ